MKIRLFSDFTGLVDTASPLRESTQHINFYLLCLSHLAGQGLVTSLFPDTEDGIAWLKPAKVRRLQPEVCLVQIQMQPAAGSASFGNLAGCLPAV